ncbi:hypothetical protein BK120_08400 [Paenibacillus sp. FSL A5-0031]|uniref:hypothetical protein n=1 Tax=Paenibacillus sp. FSL A5-0031 TaxID=1920420 RepID=UPI00096F5399|nr:hypothetical protein [Paenibacillus sp. FSL A5-0031]OME86934.1 hypothetical protein BK120_08400 [Paenibacillus sp. FSL A5-0031]
MVTLPSGIKKYEATDNATVDNFNVNADLLDAKITKLDGIATGANNYTHPANHPPSIIAQDASNRFVTDAEKATWNAKASTAVATTSVAGLHSAADKSKLDGIAAGANNYVHPANHPPSIITQDASNRFVTDTEKSTWNAKASTAVATTGANGLMSAADKARLDGLDCVIGTYTGNGVGVRSIALGFTPKYLIILLENITTTVGGTTPAATIGRAETVNGGAGIVAWNGIYANIIDSSTTLSIVSNGFNVSNSAADYQIKQFNCSGSVYRYIAYK